MSSIYGWVTDEAKNAYIDNIINWAEGQMPNSVNDSFRNMMQRVAEYLADQSGAAVGELVIQSGSPVTSDIYVKTASNPPKYQEGIVLTFRVYSPRFVKCNMGVTRMAMNDLESKPMYTAKHTGKQPITGTELRVGSVYSAIYLDDGWFVLNPTLLPEEIESHHNKVPHGLIFNFGMQEIPSGWLLCDGTAYSRNDYPNLYAAIGTLWGFGTEPDTFKVPDLRGLFLRGNSDQHFFGMYELDEFGRHQHNLSLTPMYEGKTPRELLAIMLGHPPIYNYNLGDYIKQYHDELFVVEDQYLGMLFFDASGYRCHPFTGRRLRCTPTPGMLLFAQATTIFFSRPPMPGMEHIDPAGKYDFDEYMADSGFDLCEALGEEGCSDGEAKEDQAASEEDTHASGPPPEEGTPPTPPGSPHRPSSPPSRPLGYDKMVRLGLKAMKTAFENRELSTFHPKYGVGYILDDHLWREQYGAYPIASMPLGTDRYHRQDEPFEPEPFDDLYPLCKGARHTHMLHVLSAGAGETRPINVAINYGIKA